MVRAGSGGLIIIMSAAREGLPGWTTIAKRRSWRTSMGPRYRCSMVRARDYICQPIHAAAAFAGVFSCACRKTKVRLPTPCGDERVGHMTQRGSIIAHANARLKGSATPVAQGGRYAWWAVTILSIGMVVGALDRQVINLVVDPLKQALRLNDEQVSLLQGFAVAAFYAVMAVPLGRFADRHNRKGLILAGAVAWSAATAGCGLASGFLGLFVARMMVGVGEATLTPAGFSMISDYFEERGQARPLCVFTGASFLGSGLALLLGGGLLAVLGRSGPLILPGLGRLADWQAAFILASVPGLVFAAFLLSVREPARRLKADEPPDAAFTDVLNFIGGNVRLVAPLLLGFAILASGQFALGAWTPTFFVRTFHSKPAFVGMTYGLLLAFGGSAGVVVGGFICDRMKARGWAGANLLVSIGAALAAIPFAAVFPFASSSNLALWLIAPLAFLGPMPFGAGIAAIPAISPNRMRAQMMALYLLLANLLGVGGGPWLVAVVTDRVFRNPAMLRYSLAIVGPALLLGGALLLSCAVRPFAAAHDAGAKRRTLSSWTK